MATASQADNREICSLNHSANQTSAAHQSATQVSYLTRSSGNYRRGYPSDYIIKDWAPTGLVLGSGSCAEVSLAVNLEDGRPFALKSAPSHRSASLRRELGILRGLDSPHIVKCFGASFGSGSGLDPCDLRTSTRQPDFPDRRRLHLFLEYIDHGSLAQALRAGHRFREPDVRLVTRSIVRGLVYLHARGIAHCDIKAANILVGASGSGGRGTKLIKIADFGCACIVSGREDRCCLEDNMNEACGRGSGLWMAPEAMMGEAQGLAGDVWSLGCTVIEILQGGRMPWSQQHGETSLEEMNGLLLRIVRSREATPPIPACASPDAAGFLRACLQRDPTKRWSAKRLLEHPFLRESPDLHPNNPNPNTFMIARPIPYYYDHLPSPPDMITLVINSSNDPPIESSSIADSMRSDSRLGLRFPDNNRRCTSSPKCNRDCVPLVGDGLTIKCRRLQSGSIANCECITPCDGSPRAVLDLDLIESDEESDDEIEDLVTFVGQIGSWSSPRLESEEGKRDENNGSSQRIHGDIEIDWITVRRSIGWSKNDSDLIKPFVAIDQQQEEKKVYGELSMAFLRSLRHRISSTTSD